MQKSELEWRTAQHVMRSGLLMKPCHGAAAAVLDLNLFGKVHTHICRDSCQGEENCSTRYDFIVIHTGMKPLLLHVNVSLL